MRLFIKSLKDVYILLLANLSKAPETLTKQPKLL